MRFPGFQWHFPEVLLSLRHCLLLWSGLPTCSLESRPQEELQGATPLNPGRPLSPLIISPEKFARPRPARGVPLAQLPKFSPGPFEGPGPAPARQKWPKSPPLHTLHMAFFLSPRTQLTEEIGFNWKAWRWCEGGILLLRPLLCVCFCFVLKSTPFPVGAALIQPSSSPLHPHKQGSAGLSEDGLWV